MLMQAYCGYEKESRHECAVLVFARTAREAKPLAARALASLVEARYTAVRIERIWKHPLWFRSLQRATSPHVIANPPSCDRCQQWGEPIEHGLCSSCREAEDDDDVRGAA